MTILLTGGAGYLGFALAECLAKNEAVKQIILYDNLSRHNENILFGNIANAHKLKLIKADILDSRKLKQQLKNVDVVYHMAAKVITPFANQDPHFFEQINNWGTAELTYAVQESSVKKLIYISSVSVYDRIDEEATEQTIPNPHTYYGISKLRGEEHIDRLKNKLETYIIRCGNIYGFSKAMRFDAVINNFMMQVNFDNKISIHGSGKQTRAFIHIDTACSVLEQLPFKSIPSGRYNLVTKNLSVNDIADTLQQIYPGSERLFINQHLNLGSIRVSEESKLWNYLLINKNELFDELCEFKKQFAFGI